MYNFALMNNYCDLTSSELLDIILQGNELSDEVMYYVLKERVGGRLKEKYNTHVKVIFEEFEDVVDDFFLYLREGKGKKKEPYHILHTIINKESFEGWLASTFRNYLTNRNKAEEEQRCELNEQMHSYVNEEEDKELLMEKAAMLIAYSHQVFLPRGRFIFLRSILTLLNKDNALPDMEMAEALGMSHIHYRVTAHRMKRNVLKFKQRMESGEKLRLDDVHKAMAERIGDDFDLLYPTLIHYYNNTLLSLKQEPEITALRKQHYALTGFMLHEKEIDYRTLTIRLFWTKLINWLAK